MHTYGGSFMYHIVDNDQPLVLVGYVVSGAEEPMVNLNRLFYDHLGCIGL